MLAVRRSKSAPARGILNSKNKRGDAEDRKDEASAKHAPCYPSPVPGGVNGPFLPKIARNPIAIRVWCPPPSPRRAGSMKLTWNSLILAALIAAAAIPAYAQNGALKVGSFPAGAP